MGWPAVPVADRRVYNDTAAAAVSDRLSLSLNVFLLAQLERLQ